MNSSINNEGTNYGSYEEMSSCADYILSHIDFKPEFGLILGTSLGSLVNDIKNPITIDYKDIPHFLRSTVSSHEGKLYLGELYGKKVACMSGRFHFYEGYDMRQLAIPPRMFKLIGCRALILTNAAGAVNPSYHVGDIMVIRDSIKFTGASPISGPNDKRFGPRFIEVTDMFDQSWADQVAAIGRAAGLPIQEGVYFFMSGPQFETAAEIRAIRILGGDAVGMSTVPDAIAAAHVGLHTLGLSLMTNMATGVISGPVDTDGVGEIGRQASAYFKKYLEEILTHASFA